MKKTALRFITVLMVCGALSAYTVSAQENIYTLGNPEIQYKSISILNDSGAYNSYFTFSEGCTVSLTKNQTIKMSRTDTSSAGASFYFGKGYKEYGSDENFGITNENKKYSKLTFRIKLDNANAYDNISLNFGYTPKSETYSDFQYYGRKLEYGFNIKDYLSCTNTWQNVEIPLEIFTACRTGKFCVPGTDLWTYEELDWSNINLIMLNFDKASESVGCEVGSVFFNAAESAECTAAYSLVNSSGVSVSSLAQAAGDTVSCNISVSNQKSADETVSVALLVYKFGRLTDIVTKSFSANAGTQTVINEEMYDVPVNTKNYALRLVPISGSNGIHIQGTGITLK